MKGVLVCLPPIHSQAGLFQRLPLIRNKFAGLMIIIMLLVDMVVQVVLLLVCLALNEWNE